MITYCNHVSPTFGSYLASFYAPGKDYGYLMTTKTTLARAGFILGALIISSVIGLKHTFASPILGQKIYYEGGSIQVTVLPYDASYTSALYLFSTPSPLFIAYNTDVGKVVQINNLQSLGVPVGAELVFGIIVNNTGNEFVIGPASGNSDNFVHAEVDYSQSSAGGVANISFEDLASGIIQGLAVTGVSEPDYNDANFQIIGGIGLAAIPEPMSLILLGVGLAAVVGVYYRKRDDS